MDKREFAAGRAWLQKTQIQMANLLGLSPQAVRSFEQGCRSIPPYAERQLLFLLARRRAGNRKRRSCWTVIKCPPPIRARCPAWEFRTGDLCWFVNGTLCRGKAQLNWAAKMKVCRACTMFINTTGLGRTRAAKRRVGRTAAGRQIR